MDSELINGLGPVRPRQHHVYDEQAREEAMNRMFMRFADRRRLHCRFLEEVSKRTLIPIPTLKQWRSNVLKDPLWRPRHGRPGLPRLLTETEEERLARAIREDFIDESKYISGAQLKAMGLQIWRESHPDADIADEPAFSDKWKQAFERRHGFSERCPHLRRRTEPRDDIVAIFLQEMEVVQQQLPRSLILNADETCWRILNGKLRTVAPKGADEVQVSIGFNSKETLTVMACCNASGGKLPLYAIVKGKTDRCEEALRSDRRLRAYINKSLYIAHTEKGWATADFQREYLRFIEKHVGGRYCCLLWDVHSSHRDAEVVNWARDHKMNVLFIPAGQTAEYQPLDRRVFGVLKKQAHKLLLEELQRRDLSAIDRVDALVILCQAWENISEDMIRRAWGHLIDDVQPQDGEA